MTERKTANKVVAYIMALMMVLAFMPLTARGAYAAEVQPYQIATADDLVAVAISYEKGEPLAASYELKADIDLSTINGSGMEQGEVEANTNAVWTAIGTEACPFTGSFDGNGFTVKLSGSQGLFGHVTNAVINDVILDGAVTVVEPEGDLEDTAALVECADGKTVIAGVGNNADVTAEAVSNVAGIVGHVKYDAKVTVAGVYNKGAITGYEYVGGIVGKNEGAANEEGNQVYNNLTVTSAYNTGAVASTHRQIPNNQYSYSSGICGNDCAINNVYNTGTVTGSRGNDDNYGFAIKQGASTTPTSFYYLNGSARYSYDTHRSRDNRKSQTEFENGTVLNLLSAGTAPNPPLWIAGSEIAPPAEPGDLGQEDVVVVQTTPALLFEAPIAYQITFASEALDNYGVQDAYYETQWNDAVTPAKNNGKTAIEAATDFTAVYGALRSAMKTVDAVPTKTDIDKAQNDLEEYAAQKEYNKYQKDEINGIVDEASGYIAKQLSKTAIEEISTEARTAIDNIPTSEEVAKADAAKKELSAMVITAKAIVNESEYSKDSAAVLKDAIAAAMVVYENPDAFEKDVVAAQNKIEEALLNLVRGNDSAKSVLLRSVLAAKQVNKADYTKASYDVLKSAVKAANKLIADPNADVEALKDANVTVLKAQNDLVKKAANKMTVKTTKKTVKYKKVKKSKKVVKAITVKKATGKVTYAKASGSKYLSVNKKTGKVTVKKGTKKGKHTMKVTVKAAGDDNVKAATKTVSVVIIVK